MGDVDLIEASHRNFIGGYRLLARHAEGASTYEGHGVFAFTMGVDLAIFNGCIALEHATEEAFGGALDWLVRRGVPYSVWVHEPGAKRLGGVAGVFGLDRDPDPYPGMALYPLPSAPPVPADIAIELVDDDGEADFLTLYETIGRDRATVRRLFGAAFRSDPDVRVFCARLDGEPVGTSIALRTEDVAGVYAVATAKHARKRGVGTAATWAAIEAARAWSVSTVVLQSSHMGLSIYESMGFRVVAPYATFVRPNAA